MKQPHKSENKIEFGTFKCALSRALYKMIFRKYGGSGTKFKKYIKNRQPSFQQCTQQGTVNLSEKL